ncbi:MAG: hypothetical protein ACI8P9_000940 [Parasphingorhabdus sp.]|jgi:hypothetical protein
MWEAGHPFVTGLYEQFEYSETLQSLMLIFSVGFLMAISRQDAVLRPMTLSLAFLLTAILFRENDWIADFYDQKTLHHVLIWTMLIILVALPIYCRKSLGSSLRAWIIQPGKGYVECGLLTVLVFAQLFGRKSYWTEFMNVNFERWVKNAVEEGVESLGYCLILFGVIDLFIAVRSKLSDQKSQENNSKISKDI